MCEEISRGLRKKHEAANPGIARCALKLLDNPSTESTSPTLGGDDDGAQHGRRTKPLERAGGDDPPVLTHY
jgi:hypothetical protein